MRTYDASCHCGAVRFRFRSEEIATGIRCNCSMCVRKGAVMSARYYKPDEIEILEGAEALRVYQFGDRDVAHTFCPTCGIHPFHLVVSVPPGWEGDSRPGDRRVNLGCVHGLDALSLAIDLIDGRSF